MKVNFLNFFYQYFKQTIRETLFSISVLYTNAGKPERRPRNFFILILVKDTFVSSI